jgi:hypothetical protein
MIVGLSSAPPQVPGPLVDEASPDTRLRHAAATYRRSLAWHILVTPNAVMLSLTGGLVAIAMPLPMAERTHARLLESGLSGPLCQMPGETDRAVFLADGNDLVVAQQDLPRVVSFLSAPTLVPLPPTVTKFGPVRWRIAPSKTSRWLPSASAILSYLPPAD